MFEKKWLFQENTSPHSTHTIIPSLIPQNTTVLDVGCNTGILGRILQNKNCTVDGIDILSEALTEAKPYYRTLYKHDLQTGTLGVDDRAKYDVIVFADVLEHISRPDILLRNTGKHLKHNGNVIISLPNIARFEVRWHLLWGKFEYTETGTLDRDHLRFFTYETAKKLIHTSGFTIVKMIPTGLGHKIPIFPTVLAYQFVFLCKLNK